MNDQNTINELDVDRMMDELPPAKSDAEIQCEYAAMLDNAMELSRRAMRAAKIKEAAHAATELVVSLKRSLKTGFQHFVEWAKTLKPNFDERDCALVTRGAVAPLSAVAFTKEGYGCSLSFSVQDVLPKSATMQIDLLSNDGGRLRPFELTVMDADTNNFYLKRKVFSRMTPVRIKKMTSGNYIIVAVHGDRVATLKHRIDEDPNPQRIVETPRLRIDGEAINAKFGCDGKSVKDFFKEGIKFYDQMIRYLEGRTASHKWAPADRDLVWNIFIRKILIAFSDKTRDIENISAYGKTVLISAIQTVWRKIKRYPPIISGDERSDENGKTPFETFEEDQENQEPEEEALFEQSILPYDDELATEKQEKVDELLSILPPRERMIVILRVMYEIPSVMVAACLGIDRVNTVDVAKLRAIEKMREASCSV